MGRFALLSACLLIENSQQRTIATSVRHSEAKRSVCTLERRVYHTITDDRLKAIGKQCVSLAFTLVLYVVSVKLTIDSMLIYLCMDR